MEAKHLRSSVCIDVRPARLVERAAAPSALMLFSLRGGSREGVEERKPGWVIM
jgi:hypothetical protein